MKKIFYNTLLISLILLSLSPAAEARWWIFGKSKEDVDFDYLYINDMAVDETGRDITLYRESLPGGMIYIRGRGRASGSIALAEISLDGRESWNEATLSDRGVFEYSFRPRQNKYSLFIRLTETTGQTNEVSRSGRQIIISDKNINKIIQDALDSLALAYARKDSRGFMDLVSRDFLGGDTILDSALRKDFNAFDHLDLRLTASSAVSDTSGRIRAVVNYVRSVTSSRDGKTYRNDGITEFGFELRSEKVLLHSMKHPLIFGLSEAGELASGRTVIGTNEEILLITPGGDIKKMPFEEGIKEIEQGINGTPVTFSEYITSETRDHFNFSTGEKVSLPKRPYGGPPTPLPDGYDIGLMERDYLSIQSSVGFQFLPAGTDIETLSSAPTAGYSQQAQITLDYNLNGRCIAFKLGNGSYAVMQIDRYRDYYGDNYDRIDFRYKYQSDGTNNF